MFAQGHFDLLDQTAKPALYRQLSLLFEIQQPQTTCFDNMDMCCAQEGPEFLKAALNTLWWQ